MTKQRLISVARKFYDAKNKNFRPQDWYNTLTGTNTTFSFLSEILSPIDIITLSFLLPYGNDINSLNELYDEIINRIFSYSTYEVTDTNPEEDCDDCSGGEIECNTCDNGEVDCEDCDGSGEDDEGNSCSNDYCEYGKVRCDDCGGTGYVTCDTCDGTSYITIEEACDVNQYFMVSYDEKIRELVMLAEDKDEITFDTITDKSFCCFIKSARIYYEDLEIDTQYFTEYVDNPMFIKHFNKVDISNIPDL